MSSQFLTFTSNKQVLGEKKLILFEKRKKQKKPTTKKDPVLFRGQEEEKVDPVGRRRFNYKYYYHDNYNYYNNYTLLHMCVRVKKRTNNKFILNYSKIQLGVCSAYKVDPKCKIDTFQRQSNSKVVNEFKLSLIPR